MSAKQTAESQQAQAAFAEMQQWDLLKEGEFARLVQAIRASERARVASDNARVASDAARVAAEHALVQTEAEHLQQVATAFAKGHEGLEGHLRTQ